MASDTESSATRSLGCQQGPLHNIISIKKLQYHNIIIDIGPNWYNLGIALLNENQFSQLATIEANHRDETRCCVDLFTYWVQTHSKGATWYKLVEALKSNGVKLNNVATKVEDIFPAMEPENAAVTRAMVVMPSYSDYVEQLEEKLIMEGSISQQQNPKQNTLKEMQISTQPQSQLVKPVPSSHTIPTQHLNEDVTMCATGSITEELKSMSLQNKGHHGMPHSADSTAGIQDVDSPVSPVTHDDDDDDRIDSFLTGEDCKISKRVCNAVSEFYCGQFKDRWINKTDRSTVRALAALLVERHGELKVAVLTTGTVKKKECSYSLNKSNADDLADEYTWGVCDGHAESVCLRLASLYLITEIHNYSKNPVKSILERGFGYTLKKGIKFHFFTTQPPCGFMAKEERHFLSWKIPFKGKPHCLKCSSTILIGAYLGIQGPLSHLFSEPIYISSITIPKCKNVTAQKCVYINQCFKIFQARLDEKSEDTESKYKLVIPHVEIADDQSEKLFDEYFKQYGNDVTSSSDKFQELEVERYDKEPRKTAGAVRGDDNVGSHMMVFTLKNGLDKKEFRAKIKLQVEKTFSARQLTTIKKGNLENLKEAQVRLSKVLNVSEALEKLKSLITEKISTRFITHCSSNEVIVQLKEMEECRLKMGKLTEQVNKLKDSFCASIKQFENDPNIRTEITSSTSLSDSTKKFKTDSESMIEDLGLLNKSIEDFGKGTRSIVDELTDYRDYEETLDDLITFLKEGDTSSRDSLFDLDLMGCDWARYMKLMHKDIENCS